MATSKDPNKGEDEEEASEAQQKSLFDFFKRKRGRPKKRAILATDKVKVVKKMPKKLPKYLTTRKAPPKAATTDTVPGEKINKKRTNWSLAENQSILKRAVNDWVKKEGTALDTNGEPYARLTMYASVAGIPYSTLKKYVCEDESKRRTLGNSVGRKALFSKTDQDYIADVLARKDRANDGAEPTEVYEMLQEIKPALTNVQVRQHFKRTLMPQHPEQIKPRSVAAQGTTTKRNAITVAQQFRWHTTVNAAYDWMRDKNQGRCKCGCNKMFGETIEHFIVGGNETCFQAGKDGTVRVIAAANKKKHEKKTMDSRESITLYRTGGCAGDTGPTAFLCAGQKRRVGYNEKFLSDNGAMPGSTIVMTPNAYMTIEAWEEITPMMCSGMRQLNKHVKANPDWWMVEIFDGFGAHLSSLKAMQERYDNKISSVKEEGDSSHVNQAYDKLVAKSDKRAGNESLGMLRSATFLNRGVVDQWGLIHVGLYAIRETKRDTWTRSFEACNLHPVTRMPFGDWCAKIEQYLQVGESFESEAVEVDKYTLLPSWWQAMEPEEKRNAFDVIEENGGFTMECLIELRQTCRIPTKDLQNLRVCYECAKEKPERTLPIASISMSPLHDDVHQAQAAVASVIHSLLAYQLKPEGMKCEATIC
jgi:hypothetical protein